MKASDPRGQPSPPLFRSTTMPRLAVARITRRAQKLATLDHGDLAVACARLEDAARKAISTWGRPFEERASDLAQLRGALDTLTALAD